MSRHLNDLLWSKYLTGELGWLEERRFRRHLSGCSECQEEHEAMLAEQQQFLASPDRKDEIARLKSHAQARQSVAERQFRVAGGGFQVKLVIPVAAACVALAFGIFFMQKTEKTESQSVLRTKGNNTLVIYAMRNGEVSVVKNVCHPADRLRARFWTDKKYVFIVGSDSAEQGIYPLYPMEETASVKVTESPSETSGSWILDENLGLQQIIAIFSDRPIAYSDLARDARLGPDGKYSIEIDEGAVSEFSCQKKPLVP